MNLAEFSKLSAVGLFISGIRNCFFPENKVDFQIGLAQTATSLISVIQTSGARRVINDFASVRIISCFFSTVTAYEALRKAFRDGIYDFNLIGLSLIVPSFVNLIYNKQKGRECHLKNIPVFLIKLSLVNLFLAPPSEGMNLAWRWTAKQL